MWRGCDLNEQTTDSEGALEKQKEHSSDDAEEVDTETRESHSNEIVVMTTNNGIARKWDKKDYCCYCLQPQSKLPRHLQTRHPEESDVVEFVQDKSKAARQTLLCKLRNLGNHIHNCEVKRENRGTLIVGYRPSGHVDAEDYGPCSYCYGYYVMKDLWKYRCPLKPRSFSKSTGVKIVARTHGD